MPKLLFARPPVDAVEERTIRKLAGARHAPADWIRRAQMIALSWDGMRVPGIAAAVGCSQKAVRERLARFAAEGLDGLGDRPGVGRKPRISQAQRSQLLALVASPPPGRLIRDGAGELVANEATGPAVWTLDALTAAARAAGLDIARSQVPDSAGRGRALASPPLLGHQRGSGVWPKRTRVVDYYTHPPPGATVIAADELGPVMPRTFDPPAGWSPDGHRPKAPLTYSRGPEKTWIYGGLRIGDGQAVTLVHALAQQHLLAGVSHPARAGQPDRDDRGDHRQPVQPFQPRHPGLAGRASTHPTGIHPEGRLLAESAGGLVADLPPARPRRGRPSPTRPRSPTPPSWPPPSSTAMPNPGSGDGHPHHPDPADGALPTYFEEPSIRTLSL
jgi:transposase